MKENFYRKINNIHVWDNEFKSDIFNLPNSTGIDFKIEEIGQKETISKEFLITPLIGGELEIKGASYSYDKKSNEGNIETFQGKSSELELKIYPYIQHRLMDSWYSFEYFWFIVIFLPTVILPLTLWFLLYLKNKKSNLAAEQIIKEKTPKTDKKDTGKQKSDKKPKKK